MRKVLIVIILIAISVILIVGLLAWRGYKIKKEEATITTYKTEYLKGENPKVKITNNLRERICFSSCYPYYLESNNGGFKAYKYGSCPKDNVVETCIKSGQIKAFELILDKVETKKGIYRIAVPACIGCALQENFREDMFFYSNEFIFE